jgi:NADH-quinone oxidoreductase subunit J
MDPLIQNILFYVFAVLAALFALLVVLRRNPVTSAMSMALSFAATAGILFLLGAHFLGVVQILVYTGAIVVLFSFVIMTMNVKAEEKVFRKRAPLFFGLAIAVLFLAQVIGIVQTLPASQAPAPCLVQSAGQAIDELALKDGKLTSAPSAPCAKDQAIAPCNQTCKKKCAAPCGPGCSCHQAAPGLKVDLPAINPSQAVAVAPTAHIKSQLEQGDFPDTALLGFRLFDQYYMTLIIAALTLLSATVGAVALTRKFNRD